MLASLVVTLTGPSPAAFQIFFYQATGLSLAQIGRVVGSASIVAAAMMPIAGCLSDRYHRIRIVILGYSLNVALALPVGLIWLFRRTAAPIAFIADLRRVAVQDLEAVWW